MSVLALVTVTNWSEARLAGTPIDGRPWLAHLGERLRLASCVSRVVVACHPDCVALVAPFVPAETALVSSSDALSWAATARDAALVALVPVWQLFADPARLDQIAAARCPPEATRVHAVHEHDAALVLTGGAYVEFFTARGCARAAAGHDPRGGETLAVPCAPEPPELRLAPDGDAAWGSAVQQALLADGRAHDLSAVDGVLSRAHMSRFDFWPDGVGAGPRRVLTVRCLPAASFARLLTHLGHLPGATLDVLCPSALAEATAALPAIRRVVPFGGPAFDLSGLSPGTLATLRDEGYDLCVVPRRAPCGRGFENVTPLGAASGAAVAVWMDFTGRTGLLSGLARGWEPWGTDAPPWHRVDTWRERARVALTAFTPAAAAPEHDDPHAADTLAAQRAAAIVARMDEHLACHALVDAPNAGVNLSPLLLHQVPAVVAALGGVGRVRDQGRPAALALATAVDRVIEHGVAELAATVSEIEQPEACAAVRAAAASLAALVAEVERAPAGSSDESRALAALDEMARAWIASGPALAPVIAASRRGRG